MELIIMLRWLVGWLGARRRARAKAYRPRCERSGANQVNEGVGELAAQLPRIAY
jgi:hypothetical protein